jgi:hypothetical protein
MLRKICQARSESIAVYTSSSSGPSQNAIVTRYKQGLKKGLWDFVRHLKEDLKKQMARIRAVLSSK